MSGSTNTSPLYLRLTPALWNVAFRGSAKHRKELKFILFEAIIHLCALIADRSRFRHLDPAEIEERACAFVEQQVDSGTGRLWRKAERDEICGDAHYPRVWWHLRATVYNAARRTLQFHGRRRTETNHDMATSAADAVECRAEFLQNDVTEALDELSMDAQLLRLFQQLPENQRIVVFLRVFKQMTYEEISKGIGVSENALRGRMSRAMSFMRRHLDRPTD